jgi:LmbE family N-acetylglucosaminyl deacetylase
MLMTPIYYLSPHADDVAFSCAGSVALDRLSGRKVTLITAFLSGAEAATRRQEDEKAALTLGCAYHCLDLPDATDRPEVRGSLDVFMPFGPPHLGITNEVWSRLLRHITPPAEVVAPLGVGGHIDHHIVHEAARALAYHLGRGLQLSFYEDQPYSLIPFSIGRRLDGLEAMQGAVLAPTRAAERADFSAEVDAYTSAMLTWPMCRKFLPGLRRLGCYIAARRAVQADKPGRRPGFAPRLQSVVRPIDPDAVLAQRRQAIAAYASQWPLFSDSLQSLWQLLEAYARRLGESGAVCERLWRDDGAFGR